VIVTEMTGTSTFGMRVIGSLVKLIQPSATIAAAITRGGRGCRIDHAEMLMATNVLPLHPIAERETPRFECARDHCHHMTCVRGKLNLAALSPPQWRRRELL
jgi:hypothetical protein